MPERSQRQGRATGLPAGCLDVGEHWHTLTKQANRGPDNKSDGRLDREEPICILVHRGAAEPITLCHAADGRLMAVRGLLVMSVNSTAAPRVKRTHGCLRPPFAINPLSSPVACLQNC